MKRKFLLLALIAGLAVSVAFAAGRRAPGNTARQPQNCPQTAVCRGNNTAAECPRLSNGNCPQECPRIKGGTACKGNACTVRQGCDQPRRQACDRRRGHRGCRR